MFAPGLTPTSVRLLHILALKWKRGQALRVAVADLQNTFQTTKLKDFEFFM
jgi:hypothetical protein